MIHHKKNMLMIFFIILIVFIGFYLFYFYPSSEKAVKPETNPDIIIDNRISPLTNQGLVCEINRIRHQGIIDIITKPGLQWRKKPTFYFTCTIDDQTYNSRDASTPNQKNDEPFQTWDTIFLDHKMIRDVEEEKTTSHIAIQMWVEEDKILRLKPEQIPSDSLELTYDYSTGRWTGDDKLFDKDGVGHYRGDQFEIWFNIYQIDFDHDFIPYWTEVNILHTDPCKSDLFSDPDNDGIPTTWEWRYGYDPFIWDDHEQLDPDIDGIENKEEYQMRKYFSNPFQQDIYLEIDGMKQASIVDGPHILWEESAQIVMQRFSEHNINVYIDYGWPDELVHGGGEILHHHQALSFDLGTYNQYYNHYFPEERRGIFRYCIIAHASGYATSPVSNVVDFFSVGTRNKVMLNPRMAFTPRTKRIVEAATIMHELGHTLGILSWTFQGCDNLSFGSIFNLKIRNEYKEKWGQYESVMNYFYIFEKDLLDYSDGKNGAPYDQNDWMELYLPSFQKESEVLDDPSNMNHTVDCIVIEDMPCFPKGWTYNDKLTKEFITITGNWSPIDPIPCRWKLFTRNKSTEYQSNRTIRVYAQPMYKTTIVQPQYWTLIFEGYLENNNIDVGSINKIIQK